MNSPYLRILSKDIFNIFKKNLSRICFFKKQRRVYASGGHRGLQTHLSG